MDNIQCQLQLRPVLAYRQQAIKVKKKMSGMSNAEMASAHFQAVKTLTQPRESDLSSFGHIENHRKYLSVGFTLLFQKIIKTLHGIFKV